MTVAELIELCRNVTRTPEVRIMTQESWPFECAISGVAVREEFAGAEDCDCDHVAGKPHDEDCPAWGEDDYPDGCDARDVFIVEGRQERYGSKRAWGGLRLGSWTRNRAFPKSRTPISRSYLSPGEARERSRWDGHRLL